MAARRAPWVLPALVVLLVAVPIAEVWVLIRVGHAIGTLPTLLILVAEAMLGAWLWRREGSRAWSALQATVRTGKLPATELTDAALVLVGGILLMLPGFVTDVFGLVFLLPFTRPFARRLVGAFAAQQVRSRTGVSIDGLRAQAEGRTTTIEGEVVPPSASDVANGGSSSAPRPEEQDPPAITGRVI